MCSQIKLYLLGAALYQAQCQTLPATVSTFTHGAGIEILIWINQ